jgi:DNA-binding PadR family transcriptional regulator
MPRIAVSEIDRHLPLKPVYFLILMVLLNGDRHGYGLVKEIDQRTDGGVRLEPGNLYRFIRKLLDLGMVGEAGARAADDSEDERRRYYTVTPLGRAVVSAEAARMKQLVRAVERAQG